MQSKAKKFMQQQLIRALRRQVAKVIAHEYQHGKDFHNDKVTTLKYMLTPGTISAASFLLAGMDASSTIASAGVGVLIGKIAAERKMEEDAMKAEKNWRLIMPAIEINKEVLDEEVFT